MITIPSTSLSATSAILLWSQPPFSYDPIEYALLVTRVTGDNQRLCSNVKDSKPQVLTNSTTWLLDGLEEFSTYRATIMTRFAVFGLSPVVSISHDFTTQSTGTKKICPNKNGHVMAMLTDRH